MRKVALVKSVACRSTFQNSSVDFVRYLESYAYIFSVRASFTGPLDVRD